MFCPSCGKPAEAGARFCGNCGTQMSGAGVGAGSGYPLPVPPIGKLIRPRYPRMIAGVCAAFAHQYGWDLSVVRIVTVVFALVTSGFGGLCYLAAWVIIPDAPHALPPASAYPAADNTPTGSTGNTTV